MQAREREPVLNAPWPAVFIAVSIVALYYLQSMAADPMEPVAAWGLIPIRVQAGDYVGLFTAMLLHGNWPHALVNAAFALALGTPVARLMGSSARHAIAFFLFYLFCGVGANALYVLMHASSEVPLVGASGAVSGLMGASARLMNTRGVLGPVLSRTVFSFTAAWVVLNVVLGLIGFAPGVGPAAIAWEAHLAGFFIGLLLIGPWAAWFGRRSIAEEAAQQEGPWGPAGAPVPPQAPPSDSPPPRSPSEPTRGDDRVS